MVGGAGLKWCHMTSTQLFAVCNGNISVTVVNIQREVRGHGGCRVCGVHEVCKVWCVRCAGCGVVCV